jgi:hypothetical protein
MSNVPFSSWVLDFNKILVYEWTIKLDNSYNCVPKEYNQTKKNQLVQDLSAL